MFSRAFAFIGFAILLGAYIAWPALSQFNLPPAAPGVIAQNSNSPNLPGTPGTPGMPGMPGTPTLFGGEGMPAAGAMGQSSRGGGRTTKPITPWQHPSGPPPAWLAAGLASVQAENALRQKLENTLVIESPVDMAKLLQLIRDLDIPVEINEKVLNDIGMDMAQVRALQTFDAAVAGSIRTLLSRALAKYGLAYCVRESFVEITSDQSDTNSSLRYFDLSYVQPNDSQVGGLLSTIEELLQLDNAPTAVGQLLVVRVSEAQSMEIARILSQLGQINGPSSNQRADSTVKAVPPLRASATGQRAEADGQLLFEASRSKGSRSTLPTPRQVNE